MNELQKVRNHIVIKFQSYTLVNTVTTLPDRLIDTNKETIYPMVNAEYITANVTEDIVAFSYHIKSLDQNDVYTKGTDSRLQEDTNKPDIWNETFNVCQSFINSFRQYNSDNIEMVSVSNITAVLDENVNGLSGHEFDIVLSIPNEGSVCPV